MVFFFKQKTAYEMLRSLVGSEMCIRDSLKSASKSSICSLRGFAFETVRESIKSSFASRFRSCLLYTSDAADDLPCVDLGGRRSIKKKKHKHSYDSALSTS